MFLLPKLIDVTLSFFFLFQILLVGNQRLWVSVSEPVDSVAITVSKERGGDCRAVVSSQGVLSEG